MSKSSSSRAESDDTSSKSHEDKITPSIIKHMYFNIISLTILIYSVINFLSSMDNVSLLKEPRLPSYLVMSEEAEQKFLILVYVCFVYTMLDTLYIYFIPSCVPSNQAALIYHHIGVLFLSATGYFFRQFSWHYAMTLVVELNTICLCSARVVPKPSVFYEVSLRDFAYYVVNRHLELFFRIYSNSVFLRFHAIYLVVSPIGIPVYYSCYGS